MEIKFLDLQKVTAKYADEIRQAVNRVTDSGCICKETKIKDLKLIILHISAHNIQLVVLMG